ncbi:MAG: hypothetical protein EOO60_04310 [Hymenobacter sp.]|nr:MAG: hypothetical protein EOO60_04310 [Hymenobacter sp.]
MLIPRRPQFFNNLALLLALLVIAGLRLWRLDEAGVCEYDSVSNWQTVLSLASGDGRVLFHHAAPGFTLLFVPVAWFTHNFLVFQVLHAIAGVVSLGIFGRFISRAGQLGPTATAAVVLLAGTSLLLTFSGRDFIENAVSLGLASGLLSSYFERLHTHQPVALLRTAGWLAVGLCVSFKLLFLVPILLLLEWWAADGLLAKSGTWWRALIILAVPYVVFGAIGVAAGLPWYRWLGVYYRHLVPEQANLAGAKTGVRLEPLFYIRYLLNFEPVLLLGLMIGIWVWRSPQHWRRGQPLALGPYLLVWAVGLLLGLSFVSKAPRALLFAYAPLAALLVMGLGRLLPARAALLVWLAAIGLNIFILQRELYQYLPTHYPQVAAWLRSHRAQRISSTAGKGLAPFLKDNQTLILVTNERELTTLRQQGYQYVLLDSYWRPTGITQFDSLRRQQPLAAWPEPQLTTPLLFLEHAEYTGLSYDQTLAAQHTAALDTLQLRLYHL